MRWSSALPIALLLAGVATIAFSVASGGARLYLVVIIPVIAGSSWTLGLGVALLAAGFLTIPFAFLAPRAEPEATSGPVPEPGEAAGGSGGFALIGPVPIVWGSWSHISRRTRVLLGVLGGAVVVALVVLWFFAVG